MKFYCALIFCILAVANVQGQTHTAPGPISTSAPKVATTQPPKVETSTANIPTTSNDSDTSVANSSPSTESIDTTTHEANTNGTDEPTTAPTTVPTTPTPPKPTLGKYTVRGKDNVTCIRLNVAAQLSITYTKTDNKTETVKLNVAKAEPDGSCGNTSHIQLKFNDVWSLTFTFGKDGKDMMISSVTCHADKLNPKEFPLAPGGLKIEAKSDEAFATCKVGNSYMCNAKQSFKLNDTLTATTKVDLELTDMQVQAYMSAKETDFGEAQECKADVETSNLVPIIVGAVLAALVVIVLVAYLITRNRSQRGYESV